MKKRRFSWVLLAVSFVFLIIGFTAPFIALRNYIPVGGLVGGADTPTYWHIMLDQFEMNGWPMCFVLSGIAMCLTALFRLIFPGTVNKCCPKSTTLVTLGISAFGGIGLFFGMATMIVFGFANPAEYPIASAVYTAIAVICLLCFMALFCFYSFLRSTHASKLGVFLDVVTSILHMPAFVWTFGILFENAEAIYHNLKQ